MGTTWGQPIDFWKGELEGPAEKGKTPNSISSVVATDPSLIFSNLRVTRLFYPVILVLSDGVLVHWCGTGETFFVHCWCPVGVLSLDCANKSSATAAETCRLRPKPSPDIIIPARHYHPRIITPLIILQLFNKSWRAFHAGLGGPSLWVVGSHRWMEGRSARPQMDQIAVAPI